MVRSASVIRCSKSGYPERRTTWATIIAVTTPIPVAVLAGERPGGSALAQHFGQRSSVLVALAGATPLEWALQALAQSQCVHGGWILGPDQSLLTEHPGATKAIDQLQLQWHAPEAGPAASLLSLSQNNSSFPLLVTTADHALLTPQIVDHFVNAALSQNADLVVGLVPYPLVAEQWPDSQRTQLKFAEGRYCGANLFLLRTRRAERALHLWVSFEAARKRPWKLARRLGFATLLRYVTGSLRKEAAAARFAALSNAQVAFVELPFARAAVDVDSVVDWELAQTQLQADQCATPGPQPSVEPPS